MYIRKPFVERVAFNKKNILRRDHYTCQYCSRRGDRLTVDHVVPRSRGGGTTWTNVVAACLRCNLHKGNRTADEAGHGARPRAGASAVPLLGAPPPPPARVLRSSTPGGSTSTRSRQPSPRAPERPAVRRVHWQSGMPPFRLVSDYTAKGDQPGAIARLVRLARRGARPLRAARA